MEIRNIEFGNLKITECIFIPSSMNVSRFIRVFIAGGLSQKEINSVNVCRNLVRILKSTNFVDLLNFEIHILPFINLYNIQDNYIEKNTPFSHVSYPQINLENFDQDCFDFINLYLAKFDFGIFLLDSYSHYKHKPFFFDLSKFVEDIDFKDKNTRLICDFLKEKYFVNNICIAINTYKYSIKTTKPFIKIIKSILLDLNHASFDKFLIDKKYKKYFVNDLGKIETKIDGFWFPRHNLDSNKLKKTKSTLGVVYRVINDKTFPIKLDSDNKSIIALLLENYVNTGDILCFYRN